MEKIKLDRKRFEFELDGQKIEVKSPTIQMVKNYGKEQKAEDFDAIEGAIGFLEKLGMKKEITETLELAHMEIIIEAVTGQNEKKS